MGGKGPFVAENVDRVLYQNARCKPNFQRIINAGASAECLELLVELLDIDPNRRPSAASIANSTWLKEESAVREQAAGRQEQGDAIDAAAQNRAALIEASVGAYHSDQSEGKQEQRQPVAKSAVGAKGKRVFKSIVPPKLGGLTELFGRQHSRNNAQHLPVDSPGLCRNLDDTTADDIPSEGNVIRAKRSGMKWNPLRFLSRERGSNTVERKGRFLEKPKEKRNPMTFVSNSSSCSSTSNVSWKTYDSSILSVTTTAEGDDPSSSSRTSGGNAHRKSTIVVRQVSEAERAHRRETF